MIHEFTMKNKLKVIGLESHKSPVVSVQMWVKNGSADEDPPDQGLSHFIEHLVFKGSKEFAVGEIAKTVEACGGEINAYTSFDQTVFYVTISKQYMDTALNVIGQMMGAPTFDGDEIDREREVVIEEIKRSEDSLSRCASRMMFEELYDGYPYSIPVIGYENIIRDCSHDQLRDFFKARYVTDNMFLLVAGDFEPEELEKKVQKHFSEIPEGEAYRAQRPPVPEIQKRKVRVDTSKFKENLMYLSFPTISILDKEVAALDVFSLILGQGGSSRLVKRLRLEDPCVKSISAGGWHPLTKGFLTITSSFQVEKVQEILDKISEELTLLFANGIDDTELEKAKVNLISDEAYSLETVGGIAQKYGSNYDSAKDLHFHEKYFRALKELSASDVLKVAKKYLSPERLVATALVAEEADKVRLALENWSFKTDVINESSSAALPGPTFSTSSKKESKKLSQVKLKNGLTVFSYPTKSAPIFNLRIAGLGGSRVITENQQGLTELLRRLWSVETKNMNEQAMRAKLDLLASSLYSFAGRNTFGLVVDGLTSNEKALGDLFLQVSKEALCNQPQIDREKSLMLEQIKFREDNPAQLCIKGFNELLFKNHPYSFDALGTPETLSSLGGNELNEYIKKYWGNDGTYCVLSGDFDEDYWLQTLESSFDLRTGPTVSSLVKPLENFSSNASFYRQSEKEQSHMIVGFRSEPLLSEDRFVLQVIEAILAGQGGRLFLELRDKASLAYSVSPLKMEGLEGGYFAAYIGCSPDKVQKAKDMMMQEFEKLQTQKVSQEEIDRSTQYLMGSHDIHLQKNSAIGSAILFNEIYGLSHEEVFNYEKFIRSVTSEDVMRVANKIFSQPHCMSLVGPENPFA